MPFTVEAMQDGEYVRTTMTGVLTKEDHLNARAESGGVLQGRGWNRLLVDVTQGDPKMSVVDDFEFTGDHTQRLPVGIRIAVVHRAGEEEHFRFIENVARNRGVDMRMFTAGEAATEWLLES